MHNLNKIITIPIEVKDRELRREDWYTEAVAHKAHKMLPTKFFYRVNRPTFGICMDVAQK